MHQIIPSGKEWFVQEIAKTAQETQDTIIMDSHLRSQEEIADRLDTAVVQLTDEAAKVYIGDDVEVSGVMWVPRVREDGSLDITYGKLIRDLRRGIAAGFKSRVETETTDWLGKGSSFRRPELAHAVQIGTVQQSTWLSQQLILPMLAAPVSTTRLRRVSDSNFEKHLYFGSKLDFEKSQPAELRDIVSEAAPNELMQLLSTFFMKQGAALGTTSPLMNTLRGYATHGLDLRNRHIELRVGSMLRPREQGPYVEEETTVVQGWVEALCYAPVNLIEPRQATPHRLSKQELYVNMSLTPQATFHSNVLIRAQDITSYEHIQHRS